MIGQYEFWLIGLCLLLFAALSVKMAWLTLGGAIGMAVMGMLIDLAFGLQGLFIIFLFFITSNLIGKFLRKGLKASRHEARTLQQVLANGGVPLLAAIFVVLGGSPLFGVGCFLTAVAGATADTWASEAGSIKGGIPYHIGLRRQVPSGLSGAVTVLGSSYGAAGAIVIGIVSALLFTHEFNVWGVVIIVLAGWGGQWIDTVLGAYFQARYQCQMCGVLTDHPGHCGQETRLVHGYPWMTNHLVNACSSVLAGLAGGLFFLILGGI